LSAAPAVHADAALGHQPVIARDGLQPGRQLLRPGPHLRQEGVAADLVQHRQAHRRHQRVAAVGAALVASLEAVQLLGAR